MAKAYKYTLKNIRKRLEQGRQVRVGFGVVFDSVFPLASVFELMRKDAIFDPFLIPIPFASRGKQTERSQFETTLKSLESAFPGARILNPYDAATDTYRDISGECDFYCTANPYDGLTRPRFGIEYFWKKHIPVAYANYGINIARFYQEFMQTEKCFGQLWRVYADNQWCHAALAANPYSPQILLSGSPKMDILATQKIEKRDRKRIIIGLHHSIKKGLCPIRFGTFLEYADFYKALPARYPDIDFVIRPHPMLFSSLALGQIWGPERAEAYWKEVEGIPNVELQRSGEFYEAFANSDGLIHDCGGFTAEYLYTGKPCCKVMPETVDLDAEYGDFGKLCVDAHYKAFREQDIIDFIEKVILKGDDPLKTSRDAFHAMVAVNYPNAAGVIVDDMKREILTS